MASKLDRKVINAIAGTVLARARMNYNAFMRRARGDLEITTIFHGSSGTCGLHNQSLLDSPKLVESANYTVVIN